jgi:signal peptidase I
LTFKKTADNSCKPDIKKLIISGDSLEPLYKNGDTVKVDYNFQKCKGKTALLRNDIIVFKTGEKGEMIIKMLLGLPGDKFLVKDNRIYINDSILRNPEGQEYELDNSSFKLLKLYSDDYNGKIPDGLFLVMGSKLGAMGSNTFGLVSLNQLIGKVVK